MTRILRIVGVVLLLCGISTTASGQKIKYWFDEDDARAIVTSSRHFKANVKGLQPGLHSLHVQAIGQDGRASVPVKRYFVRTLSSQGQSRYWFDGDEQQAQSTLMSGSFSIDVSTLPDGFHTLHLQTTDGDWRTTVVSRPFVKVPALNLIDHLTCVCHIDGEEFMREELPAAGGVVNWPLDVNDVKQGLHKLQVQVLMPDGKLTSSYDAWFIRTATVSEYRQLQLMWTVDDGLYSGQTNTQLASEGNAYHIDLDVTSLREGLHKLTYYLSDGTGVQTETHTAFFLKVPEGGNGITAYDIWVNDLDEEMQSVSLSTPVNPLRLTETIDVGRQPLRTKSFHFCITSDKRAMMFAKNQLHLRFHNKAGRSTETICDYIDPEVSQQVETMGELLSEPNHTRNKPAADEVHWYKISMNPGDSLTLRSSRQCMLDVFTPNGDVVYHAQDGATTLFGGFEAADSTTYYIALHDMATNGNYTLDYVYSQWVTPDLAVKMATMPAPTTITEGEQATLIVSRNRMTQAAATINLSCDQPDRFRIPARVKIPAGKDSVAVSVQTVDDERYNKPTLVTFTVEAQRHNNGTMQLSIVDNELPMNATEWNMLKTWCAHHDGNAWKQQWEFGNTPAETDSLYGVLMRNSHVKAIHLSNNNLSGQMQNGMLQLSQMRELDLSHNALSGNVTTIVQDCPALTKLNVSYNHFSELTPALPATITELHIDHQVFDRPLVMSSVYSERAEAVPSIVCYRHGQEPAYSDEFSLGLSNTDGWGAQLNASADYWRVAASRRAVYSQQSGQRVTAIDTRQGHQMEMVVDFNTGDVNFDYDTNVADLQHTVNFAMDDNLTGVYNFTAANLMADDVVNVLDIVQLVNLLLSPPSLASPHLRTRDYPRFCEDGSAWLTIRDGKLILTTMQPVAAIDIVLSKQAGQHIQWVPRSDGYLLSSREGEGYVHFIHYSLSGKMIPAGETVLAAIDGEQSEVLRVMMVDKEAQPIAVADDSATPTGISEMQNSEVDDHYYTPEGIQVSTPSRGVYIKRGKKFVSSK